MLILLVPGRHVRGRMVRDLVAAVLLGACAGPPSPGAPARAPTLSATQIDRGVNLRVVSFNAWFVPPPLSEDLDARLERLPVALRALDADVICLQEVWLPDARALLERALAPEYAAAPSTGGGLMVLARLPIVAERFTRFPDVPGASLVERIAGKGMLEVQVRTGLGLIRVVDAHLAAGDVLARDTQLEFLLAHTSRDLPLVVAADANFWKVWQGVPTPQYESVIAAGWLDAAPPRRTPEGRFDAGEPTRPGYPRGRRDEWGPTFPDHIFYAPAAGVTLRAGGFRQALDTPQSALSDHNALVADFVLNRQEVAK